MCIEYRYYTKKRTYNYLYLLIELGNAFFFFIIISFKILILQYFNKILLLPANIIRIIPVDYKLFVLLILVLIILFIISF